MKDNWKRKVGLFFSSQAISLFGSSLVQYAIIWHITLTTQSGLMTTIATLCGFIPQVLISFFAGVWADKYNKKKLIIMADGFIALATFLIALSFLLGYREMWLLFAVLVVRSIGNGVQTPAVSSFIPEIAPEDKLMKVNGMNTTIQAVMLILSPAAGGALLANVPLEYIFFIDIFTAIIGIFILLSVKYNFVKKVEGKVDYFASIKEGILYTKGNKLISRLIFYMTISNILIAPIAILTPLLVTRSFGADPMFLTFNEISFFVGNIVGGIIISAWGGFKKRHYTVGLACMLCGVVSIVIGFPLSFPVYLVFIVLCGFTMPFINTPVITLFQENIAPDKIGRVFSLITIISGSVMPLAMVFFGPLADYFKIEHIILVTGFLFALLTIVFVRDKILIAASMPKSASIKE